MLRDGERRLATVVHCQREHHQEVEEDDRDAAKGATGPLEERQARDARHDLA